MWILRWAAASMSYEFRILGQVGLSHGGRPMALGPPRRMAMLTALLPDTNRPVPVPRVTEAMWSDPPHSAVANLRTHAWALRRLLGGRLVTGSHSYRLRLADDELDASEFARLARTGREALTGGEPGLANVRLGAALALCSGMAGSGLPGGTSLDARLGSLDQQRLDVFEDHTEARLHTAAYSEVAADLRRHLDAWPTRERAWELLMLALYRSGNSSGALAAYAAARGALRKELGIEPGGRLQRLQRAAESLIFLEHDLSTLNLDNTAVAGHEFSFGVEPYYQAGAEGEIVHVAAEASFDDGDSWREASVAERDGGTYEVTVDIRRRRIVLARSRSVSRRGMLLVGR